MNNFNFISEILLALKCELIRYRLAAVVLFSVVLLSVLAVGVTWSNTYVTSSVLSVDDTNLIQPLLAGRATVAEVDTSAIAQEKVYSEELLKKVADKLGYLAEDTTDEELGSIVAHIGSGITLEPSTRGNRFLTISYTDTNPDRSYQTLKVLVGEFIEYHESSKREEGVYAFGFISKQVDTYKKRLEVAEQKIKEFKASSLDITEDTVQRRMVELDSEIQELRLSIQEDTSRIRNIDSQLGAESEYLEKQSSVYALRSQKAAMEDQLRVLRMQFQESYPDIVTIKEQLNEVNRQLKAQGAGSGMFASGGFLGGAGTDNDPETLFRDLRRQKSQTKVDLKTKEQRLESLIELLVQEQQKAEIVASNQAKLADLRRDYDVTKDVYEEMLARKENAELSMAITQEGQGISYEVDKDPVFPLYPTGLTFKHFLLAAPVLAVGAPIGLLLALILLDPRVRTVTTMEPIIEDEVKLLGVVPHYHSAFSDRLLKKDMFLLSIAVFGVCCIYLYVSITNLLSS